VRSLAQRKREGRDGEGQSTLESAGKHFPMRLASGSGRERSPMVAGRQAKV
jgi:hypothetical protein